MGLLSFFSPQNEERLHQQLADILAEYHRLKAIIEQQRALTEHIRNIHSRIDVINSGIRHASTISDKPQRMSLLQHLVGSERQMLAEQRRLASRLEQSTKQVIALEKKTEHSARFLKRVS